MTYETASMQSDNLIDKLRTEMQSLRDKYQTLEAEFASTRAILAQLEKQHAIALEDQQRLLHRNEDLAKEVGHLRARLYDLQHPPQK